ncbi:hypothetical protein BDV98DRAFT_576939, partial [Pterulicium gracile]
MPKTTTSQLRISSPFSEYDLSTPEPEAEPKSEVQPPRPANEFMLFRKDLCESVRLASAVGEKAPAKKVVSNLAAARWRELGEAEKAKWTARAAAAKREHEIQYPSCQYKPKRSKKGKAKRGKVNAAKKQVLGEKIASKKTPGACASRSRSRSVSSAASGSSSGSSESGRSSSTASGPTSRESSYEPSPDAIFPPTSLPISTTVPTAISPPS